MKDRLAPRRVLASVDDVLSAVGTPLGTSGWHRITQRAIDAFAEGTGNFAPNHTDPEYAARTPLRVTIAFGMQILAMATLVLADLWELRNVTSGADYGCNRVRHLAPVPVDSRVRATATIAAAEPVGEDAVRLITDLEFEVEGGTRPVCVAQVVNVLHFAPACEGRVPGRGRAQAAGAGSPACAARRVARALGPPGEVPLRIETTSSATPGALRSARRSGQRRASAIVRRTVATLRTRPSADTGESPHPNLRGPNQTFSPTSGVVRMTTSMAAPMSVRSRGTERTLPRG